MNKKRRDSMPGQSRCQAYLRLVKCVTITRKLLTAINLVTPALIPSNGLRVQLFASAFVKMGLVDPISEHWCALEVYQYSKSDPADIA